MMQSITTVSHYSVKNCMSNLTKDGQHIKILYFRFLPGIPSYSFQCFLVLWIESVLHGLRITHVHLANIPAMSKNEDVARWEAVALRVEEALADDNHEFWDWLDNSLSSPDPATQVLQSHSQIADNEKRKEQNLPPRPWEEIEKELEEKSEETMKSFDEYLMNWDAEARKEKGLGPRSKEEMEEEIMPKLFGLECEVFYKMDAQKRKEKGLGPRPEEEFEKVLLEEGIEVLKASWV